MKPSRDDKKLSHECGSRPAVIPKAVKCALSEVEANLLSVGSPVPPDLFGTPGFGPTLSAVGTLENSPALQSRDRNQTLGHVP